MKLKSVQCVKDLGVEIASNLKFSQKSNDGTNKAKSMLGFTKMNFSFENKYAALSLDNSLIRPHLEYAIKSWSFH